VRETREQVKLSSNWVELGTGEVRCFCFDLKLHKTKKVKNIIIKEKFILRLTFNLSVNRLPKNSEAGMGLDALYRLERCTNCDFLGSALMTELWLCGTQGLHLLLL